MVPRESWSSSLSRVEIGTARVLENLDRHETRATFFVLGWIAEHHPGLVRRIAQAGHEIASHGYGHELVTSLDNRRFRSDVRRAKNVLEDLVGTPVVGYRAPSFTIVRSTLWALPILVEEGYAYDSSIVPIRHDRYGIPGSPASPHVVQTTSGPIREIPPSTLQVSGIRFPVCGGGYLRQYPFMVFRWMVRQVASRGDPIILFIHPWELDPDQPRLSADLVSRLRHYRNLGKTSERMQQLLAEFSFGRVRDIFPSLADAKMSRD